MPYPNEVIQLIKEHNVVTVQGNHDQIIGRSDRITTKEINTMSDEMISNKLITLLEQGI